MSEMSALQGVIQRLREGQPLSEAAIDEIDRLLATLRNAGWSGWIPADEAVAILVEARDRGPDG